MSRIKRTRPSPALVISIVAMFAALGGGAFAATATTSKQALNNKGNLNKNVVKKKNIAKKAVVTSKIKNGKVTGSKLSDESVSGEKLGPISQVDGTPTALSEVTGANGTSTATCPADSKVVGGGYGTNTDLATTGRLVWGVESKRSNGGWSATGVSVAAPGGTITAYAYCLDSNG